MWHKFSKLSFSDYVKQYKIFAFENLIKISQIQELLFCYAVACRIRPNKR